MHNKRDLPSQKAAAKHNENKSFWRDTGRKRGLLVMAFLGLVLGVALAKVPGHRASSLAEFDPEKSAPQSFASADAGEGQALAKPIEKKHKRSPPEVTADVESDEAQGEVMDKLRAVFGNEEFPTILPSPVYHPRPESEWQGMLINTELQAYCEGKHSCGLAMACKENLCGACTLNSDCAQGETCVLDHCIRTENQTCRAASDCGMNEACVLSGYSDGPRGNESTRSYCQTIEAGIEPDDSMADDPILNDPGPFAAARPVSIEQLKDTLLMHEAYLGVDQNATEQRQIELDTEPFDEHTEEMEFRKHEDLDIVDPEEEHEVVMDESEEESFEDPDSMDQELP